MIFAVMAGLGGILLSALAARLKGRAGEGNTPAAKELARASGIFMAALMILPFTALALVYAFMPYLFWR